MLGRVEPWRMPDRVPRQRGASLRRGHDDQATRFAQPSQHACRARRVGHVFYHGPACDYVKATRARGQGLLVVHVAFDEPHTRRERRRLDEIHHRGVEAGRRSPVRERVVRAADVDQAAARSPTPDDLQVTLRLALQVAPGGGAPTGVVLVAAGVEGGDFCGAGKHGHRGRIAVAALTAAPRLRRHRVPTRPARQRGRLKSACCSAMMMDMTDISTMADCPNDVKRPRRHPVDTTAR